MSSERSLTARLEKLRHLQRERSTRKISVQPIAAALIEAGCTSLDAQARALGLSRSTVWTIMKAKHKLGRLNTKTAHCILTNADTPVLVRAAIERMLTNPFD
jgi:DNA invertase Pin-like site-specific DNA recombinase